MTRFSLNSLFSLLIVLTCFVVIALDRTGALPALRPVTTLLYNWALLLAGFALLLGVVNVLLVHLRRIYSGQPDWVMSIGLVVALLAVLIAGLLDGRGAAGPVVEWLFDSIIAPGQATLFALLAFFMAAAAYRYLRIGRVGGGWMLIGALLVFLAQMPAAVALLPTELDPLVATWFLPLLTAVLRGALLGSALALLIIGVRFLVGGNE